MMVKRKEYSWTIAAPYFNRDNKQLNSYHT